MKNKSGKQQLIVFSYIYISMGFSTFNIVN